MLWIPISCFVVGACLIVYAFAMGVGLRRFPLAIALFVVGALTVGGSLAYGYWHTNHTHGVRVDVPPMTR